MLLFTLILSCGLGTGLGTRAPQFFMNKVYLLDDTTPDYTNIIRELEKIKETQSPTPSALTTPSNNSDTTVSPLDYLISIQYRVFFGLLAAFFMLLFIYITCLYCKLADIRKDEAEHSAGTSNVEEKRDNELNNAVPQIVVDMPPAAPRPVHHVPLHQPPRHPIDEGKLQEIAQIWKKKVRKGGFYENSAYEKSQEDLVASSSNSGANNYLSAGPLPAVARLQTAAAAPKLSPFSDRRIHPGIHEPYTPIPRHSRLSLPSSPTKRPSRQSVAVQSPQLAASLQQHHETVVESSMMSPGRRKLGMVHTNLPRVFTIEDIEEGDQQPTVSPHLYV